MHKFGHLAKQQQTIQNNSFIIIMSVLLQIHEKTHLLPSNWTAQHDKAAPAASLPPVALLLLSSLTNTHTHIKGACDAAVESGRCMLSSLAEWPCWALAGIKASTRPIQISVCPLLASSCIHTQWVTGQHDARILAESRSARLRLETWLACTTHD